MAKKSKGRKSKTASEMKMGTTAGATQRKFEVAQLIEGAGPANPTNIIQVDRCLNNVNRRLYRQHKVYRCKVSLGNVNEYLSGSSAPVNVYALRNTWMVRKALGLAKDIYDEAVKEERAVVGSSRWHDFRINSASITGFSGPTNYPLAAGGNGYRLITEGTAADGEYEYSAVETTDAAGAPQSKTFTLLDTSSASQYSVFDEYQKMGPTTSETPLFVSQGGYDRATGDSFEDDNVQDLLNKGNLPPYDAGNLRLTHTGNGGMFVKVGQLGRESGTAGSLRLSTDYFDAPLGLIVVEGHSFAFGGSESSIALTAATIEVECQSGDYKGVMAHDI